MLSAKQNFLETIKRGGKPDRIVRQFEGTVFLPGDPVGNYVRGERYDGMPDKKDLWGTTIIWPAGVPAAMPHVTEENKVIKDITEWRKYAAVPDLIANCSDDSLWAPYLQRVAEVDRNENLVMAFAPTGVFERLHFLMGFEDTFINLMTEPEAMKELCDAIGEYRYQGMKLMVDHVKPDIILSHDDWGSKNNLFMQPDVWREFIKPQYEKAYGYLHEHGVVIMHHADSFMEQIVEDMVDLHIDIWQGVLPQNDIIAIQKKLDGRMALMGGLDAAIVDRSDSTEEEIRRETRRALEEYCPRGNFIPCITYGGPGTIFPNGDKFINAEIDRYNKEKYGI
ncbi:Uroporphyrinogen decarboxylase (URO-D) [Sporobacter termitidis DSM 10068]|uniref:Uroporphyrinogen decarboxylase (URO-D) n=1 Tax=Sporobacter termitidis DSM 10068 TaxID=1123282 RepID=A0A1M5Z9Q9_9FIRM|nr:uroporphyrinogen decarboxylase family protein [Sporobacter termitidis]SHI20986.1 Uroporphyrinogen decarboxylase (URO-D) [Sporobacter termitidis DSM 10068]